MTTTSATAGIAGSTSSYNISSSATTATADASTSSEIQDRFLKLLVAQMNNQDPMNPMDNAQMTTQMAQINTVTGIESLNATVKAMASQQTASQMLQAGSMVGRKVLTEGNTLALDGTAAVGAVELAGDAKDVKIQVSTASGQLLDTVSLGALKAGQQGFSLDASGYPTGTGLTFKVVATAADGTAVSTTALMRDQVVAVGSNTDGLTLTLLGAGTTPYARIHSVL